MLLSHSSWTGRQSPARDHIEENPDANASDVGKVYKRLLSSTLGKPFGRQMRPVAQLPIKVHNVIVVHQQNVVQMVVIADDI